MDHWRAFFGRAGADLWTIIDQAIILAATDYPKEFKEKRCGIAETLFARKLPQFIPGDTPGDTDVMRFSGSVVTNATNRPEATEERDDANGAEHTQSLFVAEVDRHYCGDDGAEALNDELKGKVMVIKEVNTIKELLMKSEQSEMNLVELLEKLECLRINVEALKATKIGKQVNNLRKHSSKRVRTIVKQLVRSWKDLVDEWVKSGGDVTAGTRGGDDEEQGLTSLSLDGNVQLSAKTTPIELPHSRNCVDDEITGSGGADYQEENRHVQRHLESRGLQTDHIGFHLKTNLTCDDRQVPEERGSSSRVELSGLSRTERKPQSNCRDPSNQIFKDQREMDHFGRWSVTKNSTGGSGPGRPVLGVPSKSGPVLRKLEERKNIGIQGDIIQKSRDLKFSTVQKFTADDEMRMAERLDASKRALHEGYQQSENAKKQRTVQLLDIPALPKGGPIRAKMPLPGHSTVASQNWHWNQNKK